MNTFTSPPDSAQSAADASQNTLRWQLKRRRALTPRQLLLSYGALVAFSVTIALFFSLQGVWMIALWCLLEITVAGALYLFYMVHAADGEQISFSPDGHLVIEVVRGLKIQHYCMNPAWARLERTGANRQQLWLCCSLVKIEVATQLRPGESRKVEREIRQALALSQCAMTHKG